MFWYVSRDNEIFIDTDNVSRSIGHTCARLLGAIKNHKLDVTNIEWHESSDNHIHAIIRLRTPMPAMQRYIWAMILHSDIYRAACNMMRHINDIPAADILITPHCFARTPDDICYCKEKHSAAVMQDCPAAERLRGVYRVAAFFGRKDYGAKSLEEIKQFLINQ